MQTQISQLHEMLHGRLAPPPPPASSADSTTPYGAIGSSFMQSRTPAHVPKSFGPTAAKAAREAGISQEDLSRLGVLLGSASSRLSPEPGLAAKRKPAGPLDEEEEEVGVGGSSRGVLSPVGQAVVELSKITKTLAKQSPKTDPDPLERALNGLLGGISVGGDGTSTMSTRKGAAAYVSAPEEGFARVPEEDFGAYHRMNEGEEPFVRCSRVGLRQLSGPLLLLRAPQQSQQLSDERQLGLADCWCGPSVVSGGHRRSVGSCSPDASSRRTGLSRQGVLASRLGDLPDGGAAVRFFQAGHSGESQSGKVNSDAAFPASGSQGLRGDSFEIEGQRRYERKASEARAPEPISRRRVESSASAATAEVKAGGAEGGASRPVAEVLHQKEWVRAPDPFGWCFQSALVGARADDAAPVSYSLLGLWSSILHDVRRMAFPKPFKSYLKSVIFSFRCSARHTTHIDACGTSSLAAPGSGYVSSHAESQVWPLPPPHSLAWSGGACPRNPPEAHELARQSWCNMVFTFLSWLHLGKPSAAPSRACLGAPLTPGQAETAGCLETLSADANDSADICFGDLGRTATKYENLGATLSDFTRVARELMTQLDPYSGSLGAKPARGSDSRDSETTVVGRLRLRAPNLEVAKPIVSSRIKVSANPPAFDPLGLYDSSNATAFEKPSCLLLKPPYPSPPRVRIRGDRRYLRPVPAS